MKRTPPISPDSFLRRVLPILLGFLPAPAPAAAAVWKVERDGGGDTATIQEAVDLAADGDTVLIGPGVYNERLTIVEKSLRLVGELGAGSTELTTGWSGRSLTVHRSGNPVTVEGITFRQSRAGAIEYPDNSGGAILALTAPLELVDCVFVENLCIGLGGAVYCTVSQIPGIGPPLPIDDPFRFRLRVENCVFRDNVASDSGGALFAEATPVSISGSTFQTNDAVLGGALGFVGGTVAVAGSVFGSNHGAVDGGAIHFQGSGSVHAAGSTFRENTAERHGGAIRVLDALAFVLDSCRFLDNRAEEGGGGVAARAPLEARFTLWAGCEASDGGALWCQDAGASTLERCSFTGNLAGRGASAFVVRAGLTLATSILGDGGNAFWCGSQSDLDASCVLMNPDGVRCFSADSLGTVEFCAADDTAPCSLPAVEGCGTVGHATAPCGEDCPGTAVHPATWGGIKQRLGFDSAPRR